MIENDLDFQKKGFLSDISLAKKKSDILQVNSKFKKYVKSLYSILKDTPQDKKKEIGQIINNFKNEIQNKISEKEKELNSDISENNYDPYIFKPSIKCGNSHPLTKMYKKMEKFFLNLGFSIVQGPEIELDEYNFEKLNMPKFHPARDMQDTFYVMQPSLLLRSHTSSVQIRSLENMSLPLSIISPGTVYRVDDIDAQHTPMFYQVEGLVVGEKVSFSNLKYILISLLKETFGNSTQIRFRPTYYPYTEPSAAVDMSCPKCNTSGCRLCANAGWITVLGSGMVHTKVFRAVNIDSEKYTGLAFGLGLNRLTMIYFGMDEMKKFYENNIFIWNQI